MTDEQIRAIAEAVDRGIRALLDAAEATATALAQGFSVMAARAHVFTHSMMAALWRLYAEA